MTVLRPEEYQERNMQILDWPVRVTSYKLGEQYVCIVDNVSPGARLSRRYGTTREEAEQLALEDARQMLAKTRRLPVE